MKRAITLLITVVMAYALSGCGEPSNVEISSKELEKSIAAISAHTVALKDITPFEWDTFYVFDSYMPQERIEDAIGVQSDAIHETFDELTQQLIFVRNEEVVCVVIDGYKSSYRFIIDNKGNGGYRAFLQRKDDPQFAVEKKDKTIELTYIE